MLHDWKPSKLGHGNMMYSRCFTTDLEAAALGITNLCDAPAPQPKAANTNAAYEPPDDDNEYDAAGDDEEEALMNCGKYPGSQGCSLAGTEWCDWSCPFSR